MDIKILLQKIIKSEGPMRLDRFMAIVSDYYYNYRQPFGRQGDFITSPEISTSFANAIGNWLYNVIKTRQPDQFQLLELGPGNGTLIKNLLNYIKIIPELSSILKQAYLIEKSSSMISKQQQLLEGENVKWLTNISEAENIFTVVIANEFFDALPVRQFIYEKNGWKETFVGYKDTEGFSFVKTTAILSSKPDVGDILEHSYQSELYASEIASCIKRAGGSALIIDYGYTSPFKEATLQAIMNHKAVPLLKFIGEADWSAHVNFSFLEDIFSSNGLSSNLSTQRDFLIRNGIEEMIKSTPKSLDRLIGIDSMGLLFKVMEVFGERTTY